MTAPTLNALGAFARSFETSLLSASTDSSKQIRPENQTASDNNQVITHITQSTAPSLSLADRQAMRNDWNRVLMNTRTGQIESMEEHILGALHPQWAANRHTTYTPLTISLYRISHFLEGSQTDTLSIRLFMLEWFRNAHTSQDPVLRNSIAPLIETLQSFRESHYQERAQQILSVIEETQRLARSNQATGPSISASYFAQSLRRRGVDPSWMIPRENLANPQTLNETRIFQGNTGDGSIQIPILQHSTQGTITLGLREIDSNGRIRDFYAPAGSSAGSIQSSSLLAQSARILIAAAFGVEELPTGQRVLNAQERQAGSLIRSGWIDAELDALNQELTELQQRTALIRNTPNEIELNRINTRVNAIQARFEELNRLIPNS